MSRPMNHNQKKKAAKGLKMDICSTLTTKRLKMHPELASTKVIVRNKQPSTPMRRTGGLQCLQSLPRTNGQGTPLGLSHCATKSPRRIYAPQQARTPGEKPHANTEAKASAPHKKENALCAKRPLRNAGIRMAHRATGKKNSRCR